MRKMVVTVYTKPKCQPCKATTRALTRAGVPYIEHAAADYRGDLEDLGYETAPVVVVRSERGEVVDHWSGFRMERCRQLAGATV